MDNRKRNRRYFIILAAALLLLGGALWLNISSNRENAEQVGLNDKENEDTGSDESVVSMFDDYFDSFRLQRSEVRAQEIEYLRSIIDSENSDEATLADAGERLLELVANMEKEFAVESRIRSKGFLDAAATVREDNATVIINGEALSDEEVARILDIVISETGLPASGVKISLGSGG